MRREMRAIVYRTKDDRKQTFQSRANITVQCIAGQHCLFVTTRCRALAGPLQGCENMCRAGKSMHGVSTSRITASRY